MYGNMSEIRSTLGASGIKVPGTAGETSEALFDQYGIPSLIMADGPAGIRLQQTYEVDREKDTVYGTGVLGSLENGYLVGRKDHEGAERSLSSPIFTWMVRVPTVFCLKTSIKTVAHGTCTARCCRQRYGQRSY